VGFGFKATYIFRFAYHHDWKNLFQKSPWWLMKKLLLFWSNLEQESLMFFEVTIS
jgi:hypothetical protein